MLIPTCASWPRLSCPASTRMAWQSHSSASFCDQITEGCFHRADPAGPTPRNHPLLIYSDSLRSGCGSSRCRARGSDWFSWRREAVSNAWLGQNQLRMRRILLDLLAQIADVNAEVLGLVSVLSPPNPSKEVLVQDDTPRVRHELVEQLVLGGTELDVSAVGYDTPLSKIDREIAQIENRLELLRGRNPRAPQDGFDPSQQLLNAERLGEVVVCAELEALHLVDLFTLGRQDNDGDGREFTQPSAHLEPVEAR